MYFCLVKLPNTTLQFINYAYYINYNYLSYACTCIMKMSQRALRTKYLHHNGFPRDPRYSDIYNYHIDFHKFLHLHRFPDFQHIH